MPPFASPLDRRAFLIRSAAASVALALWPRMARGQAVADSTGVSTDIIEQAEQLCGLTFTPEERELMRESVAEHVQSLRAVRDLGLPNDVPPAFRFFPALDGRPPDGIDVRAGSKTAAERYVPAKAARPGKLEDLIYAPVTTLAPLLRKRQVRSTELTQLVLDRLQRVDETLHCVITYTRERAMEQAQRADREIEAGRHRGPLHGVPWGVKDLFAVAGYRTTWGAAPYREQTFDEDAEVVRRLDEAGAVLVAKTSVGALAWGDVWFDEMTRNPWNPEQGSSGSSAGSAASVAAGALPFALGTETLGSLVSPSTRCGVTAIRPTFGRVPRTGAMALSWTMDKVGPMARTVEDCALVLDTIAGPDPRDPDTVDAPLRWIDDDRLGELRVGFLESAFAQDRDQKAIDDAVLEVLRGQGLTLAPVELPEFPVWDLMVVLEVEAAAAFEELTVEGRDDELVRQVAQAWPNVFRAAQLVPAVQYVQAQRARTQLMRAYEDLFAEIDVLVAPAFVGNTLGATNLTGHPCVVVPDGFTEENTPTSITFLSGLYQEGRAAALARVYQRATGWHLRHPDL